MQMTTGQPVYTLSGQILFALFEDGGVIFNLETRESNRLNPTAAQVVALIDGHRDVNAIIAALAAENGGDIQVIRKDVESFLKAIANRGWIDEH
jgi:hypothetical protein